MQAGLPLLHSASLWLRGLPNHPNMLDCTIEVQLEDMQPTNHYLNFSAWVEPGLERPFGQHGPGSKAHPANQSHTCCIPRARLHRIHGTHHAVNRRRHLWPWLQPSGKSHHCYGQCGSDKRELMEKYTRKPAYKGRTTPAGCSVCCWKWIWYKRFHACVGLLFLGVEYGGYKRIRLPF
jgi:hypothetical protein